MKETVDVSIIIVNWHSCAYLRKCLASIANETRDLRYEIIVVDNGSYDGADAMISQEFPAVRYVQLKENVGFARANNFAYQLAKGDTLLFLNPDTEVIARGIDVLYENLERLPQAGAVGPKLLNSDGSVQTSCVQRNPTIINQLVDTEILRGLLPRSRLWGMEALYKETDGPHAVDVVSGACLMVTRNAFEAAGFFSTDYFMYAEDADLCCKIRMIGFDVYLVRKSSIVHHGGMSSAQAGSQFSAVVMQESIWRFLRKTRGSWYSTAYRGSLILAGLVRVILLSLALPVVVPRKGFRAWSCSFSKWVTIVRWGLGLPPRDLRRGCDLAAGG